jgi:hypothetical protein
MQAEAALGSARHRKVPGVYRIKRAAKQGDAANASGSLEKASLRLLVRGNGCSFAARACPQPRDGSQ